jgi:hypothetical protein
MRPVSIRRASDEPSSQRGHGSDTFPVTNPSERDAEAKALQRLRSRRLIVIEPDLTRALALAEALRASEASVAVVNSEADLVAALTLDAEAVLVDAGELAERCKPLIDLLPHHPRTRWASVIPVASTQLWPPGARMPALAAIASQVASAAAPAVELAVRAKGKLPHETQLETLGLCRMLRVLSDTQRALRIELSGEWGSAVLELGAEGKILAAQARSADRGLEVTNLDALSVMLALSTARVRILAGSAKPTRGWSLPLSVAMTRATALLQAEISAITESQHAPAPEPLRPSGQPTRPPPSSSVQPTRPQISLAEAMASAELDVITDELFSTDVPLSGIDPYESGSRPKSDLEDTRAVPVTEVLAEIDGMALRSDHPDAPAPARTRIGPRPHT